MLLGWMELEQLPAILGATWPGGAFMGKTAWWVFASLCPAGLGDKAPPHPAGLLSIQAGPSGMLSWLSMLILLPKAGAEFVLCRAVLWEWVPCWFPITPGTAALCTVSVVWLLLEPNLCCSHHPMLLIHILLYHAGSLLSTQGCPVCVCVCVAVVWCMCVLALYWTHWIWLLTRDFVHTL